VNSESILEIGAGKNANSSSYFKDFKEYLTLDPDPNTFPDKIAFGEDMPFKSQYFDTILATEVLEHCNNPVAFLRECSRVLKKGGNLILSAPFLTPIHMEWDYWRFTGKRLKKLVSKDFEIVELIKMGDSSEAIIQIFHMQYRKRALLAFIPLLRLILAILSKFKIKEISGATGYFIIAKNL